jgi:hypothetical protein
MKTKTITHPLRAITLQYDEKKEEKDYEKKVIAAYILLHDKELALANKLNELFYNYKDFDEKIAEAEKKLLPYTEEIKKYTEEMAFFVRKADEEGVEECQNKMNVYQHEILKYHESIVTPLYAQYDDYTNLFEEYEKQDAKSVKEYDLFTEKTIIELQKTPDKFSLDAAALAADTENFADVCDKKMAIAEQIDKINSKYELFDVKLGHAYQLWKDTQNLRHGFYDKDNLWDCSISDGYAAGKGEKSKRPFYAKPPGDIIVKNFKDKMRMLSNAKNHTLNLQYGMEQIKEMDTSYYQELIMGLQHFPKLIEKFIFAFKIEISDKDEKVMDEIDWKGHAIPMRWHFALSNCPCAIFFLEDHDSRAYVLYGDLMADEKMTMEPADKEGFAMFKAEGEVLQEMCNRLFHYCWFMHIYCHNSGFEPQPYIEALLAEFNLPITYPPIRKKYLANVKEGFHLRVDTTHHDKK